MKAVRVRDVKLLGMTLYRVRPGVTVNDGGVLDSTPWVLVDCERFDSKRVTRVFRAKWPGQFWDGDAPSQSEAEYANLAVTSPGWDHERALLRAEFEYTIKNPRYAIVVDWNTGDVGCFWTGGSWAGSLSWAGPLFAKKWTDRKQAETAMASLVLTQPKLIGHLALATV
jgi:hypothetical protein